MKRPDGKTIVVIAALLFVVICAAVSLGIVIHGIRTLGNDSAETTRSTTVAETTTTTKKTTISRTEKTTEKSTKQKKQSTKKTTAEATKKKKAKEPTTIKADGSRIIYLTFDDGPGPYTEQLLDILDRYDVKATFFVTNVYSKYQYCIAKEAMAGHTVGVHSYTHDYATVYKSESAYWRDFNRMNDVIKKQTGKPATLFRFPGGSSNTVSRHYKEGIMKRLTKQADQKGLTYVDWNVYDGDAGETTDPHRVFKNIIRGVQEQKKSIVLCHDVKPYTVKAMDRTIRWCLNHGYTFEVLTPGGFTVHHDVNN